MSVADTLDMVPWLVPAPPFQPGDIIRFPSWTSFDQFWGILVVLQVQGSTVRLLVCSTLSSSKAGKIICHDTKWAPYTNMVFVTRTDPGSGNVFEYRTRFQRTDHD